jgi:hypothetical protein
VSHEIIAQPGLTKVECEVICAGLDFLKKVMAEPGQVNDAGTAIKREQYTMVANNVIAKLVRNIEHLGRLRLPDVKPGGARKRTHFSG